VQPEELCYVGCGEHDLRVSDGITLVKVNLETVVLKHVGDLANKILVWLKAIELVDL